MPMGNERMARLLLLLPSAAPSGQAGSWKQEIFNFSSSKRQRQRQAALLLSLAAALEEGADSPVVGVAGCCARARREGERLGRKNSYTDCSNVSPYVRHTDPDSLRRGRGAC